MTPISMLMGSVMLLPQHRHSLFRVEPAAASPQTKHDSLAIGRGHGQKIAGIEVHRAVVADEERLAWLDIGFDVAVCVFRGAEDGVKATAELFEAAVELLLL